MKSVIETTMRVFFFFQAEDGIRDVAVTGVQTCALPIWRRAREVEPHVRAVLTRRAGRLCGREGGVRPERAPQSGQAHPDPGALRGVRPDAGASGRPAPRRAAALLKRSVA